MTTVDLDRIEAQLRMHTPMMREDCDRLLLLARRGLRAEQEVCGECAIMQPMRVPGGAACCWCVRTYRVVKLDGFCDDWRAKGGG